MDQLLSRVNQLIEAAALPSESKSSDYARSKAVSYGIELFKCWLKYVAPERSRTHVTARVLIAKEEGEAAPEKVQANFSNTRWCVDSGANRDICREPYLFNGQN